MRGLLHNRNWIRRLCCGYSDGLSATTTAEHAYPQRLPRRWGQHDKDEHEEGALGLFVDHRDTCLYLVTALCYALNNSIWFSGKRDSRSGRPGPGRPERAKSDAIRLHIDIIVSFACAVAWCPFMHSRDLLPLAEVMPPRDFASRVVCSLKPQLFQIGCAVDNSTRCSKHCFRDCANGRSDLFPLAGDVQAAARVTCSTTSFRSWNLAKNWTSNVQVAPAIFHILPSPASFENGASGDSWTPYHATEHGLAIEAVNM